MSAYLFGKLVVQNWDWYKEYKRVTEALIAKHGGRYLVKGGPSEVLEGDEKNPDAFVLVEFPTKEAARAWFNDPEYAPMIALRRKAGVETILFLIEGFPGPA